MREFVPTSSKRRFSRDPWKRRSRTRSARSALPETTMPASPKAGKFLVGKNENVARSPKLPAPRPPSVAPKACAASSITARPWRPATSRRPGMSAGPPKTCTATMARLRSVTAASTDCGSRLNVARSMSANTGIAPTRAMASAVA